MGRAVSEGVIACGRLRQTRATHQGRKESIPTSRGHVLCHVGDPHRGIGVCG
jgi:hypothetical protein